MKACSYIILTACCSSFSGKLKSSSKTVTTFFCLPVAVFPLISRRKFSQIEVLEGLNVLVCINGRKNKLRVYYLSWLRNKILKGDDVSGGRWSHTHSLKLTVFSRSSRGTR